MSLFMDQITSSYHQLYATRYAQVSSLTLLVWDYFVTLPDEEQLLWHGRWTYPRALFFINRYQTIIWQIFNTIAGFAPRNSQTLCVPPLLNFQGQAWGHHIIEAAGTSIVFCVHLILAFRIYGLYGRSRWITIFLAIVLVATLSGEIYVAIRLAPNFTRIPLPFMVNMFVCLPSETVDTSLFFVPAIVFDIVALALVVARGVSHMRMQRNYGFTGSSIMRIMLRDSVLHFLIILVVYIALAVSWIKLDIAQRFLLHGYAVSAISMTATRMLLNLKREALRSPHSSNNSSGSERMNRHEHIELPVLVPQAAPVVIDIK
ncbi:SWIM-type domain-containing protein [Pleurotus pulmonarius]